jgi:hypothetical protein
MGHEYEMYEITALTLMRNDARDERFSANLQELQQRARTLPSSPHWCKTAREVVRVLCQNVCLRACFDGPMMSDYGSGCFSQSRA